ncbi:FecR domain-containing protein [uncultured Phocaeicola sp.]|jgi:transmembrane sensor|uniref:FecR family protein n=1 Tax=uncultured Phocaeicola sp. TaxID=990718 RepID=UPI0025CCAC49|nr:FecR domain-containing protein [uncultured Phocaeicola sp.]
MNTTEEINGLLAKHFSQEPLSAAQQEELQAWINTHANEYQQLKRWMNTSLKDIPQPTFDAENAWKRIEGKLEEKDDKVFSINLKKVFVYCTIAASVILLLGIGILFNQKSESDSLLRYANETKGIKHVLLPDSTEITLYPDTRLTYEDRNIRKVNMQGKAFFHVKKDRRPFRITVSALSVEVLGTSFLVDARNENSTGVFVKNGTVRVTSDEQQATLTANDQVEVTNGKMKLGRIEDVRQVFGENIKVLTFTRTPLSEVVQEIEKYTDIRIELGKGFEQDAITTRLAITNIEDILKELTFICGCKCDTIEKEKYYKLYYE